MKLFTLLLSMLLFQPALFSQTVSKVADIHPAAAAPSSGPLFMTPYMGKLYFSMNDGPNSVGGHGRELWSYDGNIAQLEADIAPFSLLHSENSSPQHMYVYNGKLYFSAADGTNGAELWVHNGDTTYMLMDIRGGSASSNPQYFMEYNNILYFQATTSSNGAELWATDGTSVFLVTDIYSGSTSSSPSYLTVFDSKLFFSARTSAHNTELFSYNGSTVQNEADLFPGGSIGSSPTNLFAFDDDLYFSANLPGTGRELFKYDGNNFSLVSDINPGSISSSPANMKEYQGKLYFNATNINTGNELYSYDGSTLSVFDLRTGSSSSNIIDMEVLNNSLFISLDACANNYGLSCNNDEIIELDVDTFKHITNHFISPGPNTIATYQGRLYFNADDGATGRELWRYTPPCSFPIGLSVSSIKSAYNFSSAKLNWILADGATSYIINGGISGSDQSTWVKIAASGPQFTATGLNEICYVWRIKSVCGSDTSDWSGFDTFCIPPCTPPINLTSSVSSNSVTFSWDMPVANTVAYLLEARINGPTWNDAFQDIITPGSATTVTYSTNGVPPGFYKWRMLSGCNINPLRTSAFSPTAFFIIPSAPQKTEYYSISVYPNPASDYFMIDISNDEVSLGTTILITDINGRTILESTLKSKMRVSTEAFQSGLYNIRINSESGEQLYSDRLMVAH